MRVRIAKHNALAVYVLLVFGGLSVAGCHLGELVDADDPDPPADDGTPPDSSDEEPTIEATQLAFVGQPVDVTAGDMIPTIRVEARDDDGELVADFSGRVSISLASGPDDAVLGGNVDREAVDGVVEFDDLVIERAWADYTLSVTANQLNDAFSDAFSVEPGEPAAIEIVEGDNQVDTVASTLPDRFVVRVIDEYANAIPGIAVTWEVVRGEGSIAPDQARTDDDGLVSARYTQGTVAGDQIVVAGVAGVSNLSGTFVSHATPGQPTEIVVVREPANTRTGDPITPPVIVQVQDQFGNVATQVEEPVHVRIAPFTGTPLASLSGTRSRAPVKGVVTFDDLSINLPGAGYRLRFGMDTLSRDSRAFNVF